MKTAAALLLCSALVMAFALHDVTTMETQCEREITVLRCEREVLAEHFHEQLGREQWKHEIDLRNLDAAIRRQERDHEADLKMQGRITL